MVSVMWWGRHMQEGRGRDWVPHPHIVGGRLYPYVSAGGGESGCGDVMQATRIGSIYAADGV